VGLTYPQPPFPKAYHDTSLLDSSFEHFPEIGCFKVSGPPRRIRTALAISCGTSLEEVYRSRIQGLNLSDPGSPSAAGFAFLSGTARDLIGYDGKGYAAAGGSLEVADLLDPLAPVIVGGTTLSYPPHALARVGGGYWPNLNFHATLASCPENELGQNRRIEHGRGKVWGSKAIRHRQGVLADARSPWGTTIRRKTAYTLSVSSRCRGECDGHD